MTYLYHVTTEQGDKAFEDSGLVIADTCAEATKMLESHYYYYTDIVSLTIQQITDPVISFKDF